MTITLPLDQFPESVISGETPIAGVGPDMNVDADKEEEMLSAIEQQAPLDTDPEDVRNIAAGLMRARRGKEEQVGGPGEFRSEEGLERRAANIERAIGRLPGEEGGLGLLRTTYSIGKFIVDNVTGLLNIPAVGVGSALGVKETGKPFIDESRDTLLFRKDLEVKKGAYYEKYYDKLRDEGSGMVSAAISTAWRMFKDAPEVKNEGEFIAGVINRLAETKKAITPREADEITKYWRPEASTVEQVIRAVPEIGLGTLASVKWLTRGGKKLSKQLDDIYAELYPKKKGGILSASQDEVDAVIRKLIEGHSNIFWQKLRLQGVSKQLHGRRAVANVKLWQKPRLLAAKRREIDEAREKVQAATSTLFLARQHKLGKEAIDEARKKADAEKQSLRVLNRAKTNLTPVEIRNIVVTELGVQAGMITAGNLFPDNEWSPLIGALGGGITSAIGHGILVKVADGVVNAAGTFILGGGRLIGLLDDDQVESLAKNGWKKDFTDLSHGENRELKAVVDFIQSFPPEQRKQAYDQLKFFRGMTDELEGAGIDKELLVATIGEASALVPLVMMRNSIASVRLDTSKGLDKNNKAIAHLLEMETTIKQRVAAFREKLTELSQKAGANLTPNSKFNSFVRSMDDAYNKMNDAITKGKEDIDDLINQTFDIIRNPAYARLTGDGEELETLIQKIIQHHIFSDTPWSADPASSIAISDNLPKLRELVDEVYEGVIGRVEKETELAGNLNTFFSGVESQIDRGDSAENLWGAAKLFRSTVLALGQAKFDALKGSDVQIDIAPWFRSLYKDENISTARDKPLTGKKVSKLWDVATKQRVPNADVLEALSRIEGRHTVEDALKNKALKDEILTAMDEAGYKIKGPGTINTPEDLTYSELVAFLKKEFEIKNITDWDVYRIMDDLIEELADDTIPQLRMLIDPTSVVGLSSALGRLSRQAYNTDNKNISFALSRMEKELLNTVGDSNNILDKTGKQLADVEIKDRLIEAKNFWSTNVVNRYRNRGESRIGYALDSESYQMTKQFERELDVSKMMNMTSTEVDHFIDYLARVFGDLDEDTGKFSLGAVQLGPTRQAAARARVKDYLNDLVGLHILKNAAPIRGATKDPFTPPSGKILEEAGEIATEGDILRIRKALSALDYEDNAVLQRLANEGLLDLDQVIEYSTHIRNIEGTNKIIAVEQKAIASKVNTRQKAIQNAVNNRERVIKEALRGLPVAQGQGGTRTQDFDTFLEYYIVHPNGVERIEGLIKSLVDQKKGTFLELRNVLSDILLEAVSRSTYGRNIEINPGTYIKDFDYEKLFNIFHGETTANNLKHILGDEVFNRARTMSDFLRTINMDEKEMLSKRGVNVLTPRGLSIESLLSRTYSIFRGVISPKYVATEVALLGYRKRKAQVLHEILSSPGTVDKVIDALEKGPEEIQKLNAKLFDILINVFAQERILEREEKRAQQIRELELDKLNKKRTN
tara:strand:+ start:472 stop:4866 length:4395 start_codon:yes stop_codon:yes gene_type:complete